MKFGIHAPFQMQNLNFDLDFDPVKNIVLLRATNTATVSDADWNFDVS
jgi:hypothetical protein